MKKTLVFAAAVAGLVAAGLWAMRSDRPVASPDLAHPQPSESAAASSPVEACRFEAGQVIGYDYASTSTFRLSQETLRLVGGAQAARTSSTSLSGRLTLEVLSAPAGGEATVLARLSDVNEGATAAVGATVTTPFLLKVRSDCALVGYARHQTTDLAAARVQQVALYDLWFQLPAAEGVPTVEFDNGVGRARATFERTDDALGPMVQRRSSQYRLVWSSQLGTAHIADSFLNVRRTPGSTWFDSALGVEVINGGPLEEARLEVTVNTVGHDRGPLAQASRAVNDYEWVNLLSSMPRQNSLVDVSATDHELRVGQMANVSYEVALKRFEVAMESEGNIDSQWRDMAAFLDAHPSSIATYAEELTSDSFPIGWKAAGFLALGQARNEGARDALLDLYRADIGAADRIRSSLALVTRADVGVDLAKELRLNALRPRDLDSASERALSNQSALHLGILAGTHRDDGAVVAEAKGLIEQFASNAQASGEYAVLFHLMGNLGDASQLPEIERWSRTGDVDIRKKVPSALRRISVGASHDLELEWLRREESPDVKRQLFHVIHQQYLDAGRELPDDLLVEAIKHLREQPKLLTKQSLVRLIEPHVSTNDDARAALREQLRLELRTKSGLYSLIANSLPSEDVMVVLSSVDGLKGQFSQRLESTTNKPLPPAEVVTPSAFPPLEPPKTLPLEVTQ